MGFVTDTLENPNTTADPGVHRYAERPHRLYRALAWVGIAAGSLFIIATVFFSGFVLGSHGGGFHHGHQRTMVLKPFPARDDSMGPGERMGRGERSEPLTPPSSSSPARP